MDINSISSAMSTANYQYTSCHTQSENEAMKNQILNNPYQGPTTDNNSPMDSFANETPCSDAEAPPQF